MGGIFLTGNSASASALANNKCGTPASPSHYSTTQRYTYIRMVTDASVQKAGFKMEFLAAKDYCMITNLDKTLCM